MLRFNLKLIFKNLYKNKLYTFVNVVGLSVAIAVSLYTGLWVYHESTYDRFHADGEQIYRFGTRHELGSPLGPKTGSDETRTMSQAVLGATLTEKYADIFENLRLKKEKSIVGIGERKFGEVSVLFSDPNFFTFFSYPMREGNPEHVLSELNSVVLSESFARKLSDGNETLLGKTVLVNRRAYVVKGIMQDSPDRSHLQMDMVCRRRNSPDIDQKWSRYTVDNYFKIRSAEAAREIEAELYPFFVEKYAQTWKSSKEDIEKFLKGTNYVLTPLLRINQTKKLSLRILIFVGIASLILLLAVANFVSMGISQANLKSKEIGLRKVSGATKSDLIRLFLLEAGLISFTAFTLSLLLLEVSIPFLNSISERNISLYAYELSFVLPFTLLLIFCISMLGAMLPAYYLASQHVNEVLQGNAIVIKKPFFQKALSVTQFAIALLLLFVSLVVHQQLNYIQNRNLGYEKEHVLFLDMHYLQLAQIDLLKNQLKGLPEVESLTHASDPINALDGGLNFYIGGDKEREVNPSTWGVEKNFISFYGLELLHENALLANKSSGIAYVNETFFKQQHWESIEGKSVSNFMGTFEIAGVLKDFVVKTAHGATPELLAIPMEDRSKFYTDWRTVAVKLKKGVDFQHAVARIEEVWKKVYESEPIQFHFLTSDLISQYKEEYRFRKLVSGFSLIAIVLSVMGLFAFSSFTIRQRIKEFGVRKVYGANLKDILGLLFVNFSKSIFGAGILALPVGFLIMDKWLEQFAYAIQPSFFVFLLAFTCIWLVASLTVSYHSWQVARANPVDALRDE